MNPQMHERIGHGRGFIAALDQSGGSTPRALELYGLEPDSYADEAQMFERIHEMRTRIITNPAFNGDRIIGSILFEDTMRRQVEGMGTAEYLWQRKQVVPFLKVDNGLDAQERGVRLMRPAPRLPELLDAAREHGVFGTKMRSVISLADEDGIRAVVDQQFAWARQILDAVLVPIIEPEVEISSPQKEAAEIILCQLLLERLDDLPHGERVMLKLTLPTSDGFYLPLIEHPRVLRVAALSGGYSRFEATTRLARNHRMIASFSRALTEGLAVTQDDAEFTSVLNASIEEIFEASLT